MKRFIFLLLAVFLLTSTASASDYYVESDYNVTVPVNVSASGTAYLLVEHEAGYTPTTDVYDAWDAATYTGDNLGSTFVDPENIRYESEVKLSSSVAKFRFGLANTTGATDAMYLELNSNGADYGTAYSVDGGVSDSESYPYTYTSVYKDLIITTNSTHATFYFEGYGYKTVTPITDKQVAFYTDIFTSSGSVQNQKIRKHYDNEPTVTVSTFSDTLSLVTITNPNGFALTEYQVTFDVPAVDQTDESLDVTAYTALDVPVPTYPINNTNLVYEYPPVVNEINLTWNGNGGSQYSYEVRDIGGTLVASGTTSNTYAIIEIPEGSYYWTVESDLTETMETIVAYFSVSNTYITDSMTSVVGTVYHMENFVKTPIPQAVVYINNDTFSDHETVGTDGYFSFTGLAANSTYYLKASATDYDDSEVALVTPSGGNTSVKDLLLVPETKYYDSHKVNFVVQTIWGNVYPGVDVTVYKTGSINSLYEGETGTDGSITFEMDEEVEYRVTFVNSTHGIDEEITIYPIGSKYTIYPDTETVDRDSDDIKFGAIGSNINLTSGYINASFLDSSGTTTLAELWINDTDGTNLYYFNTTGSSATWSQVVAANNTTYLVHFELQNTELANSFLQDRVISFSDGVTGPFNFGFTEQWHYQVLGVAMILFVGLLFGAVNAQMGAIVVVLLGWFNVYIGWFPADVKTILMLMMATLVAGAFYLRKGEDIR